jgi:hypothetical protein
MNGVQWSVDMQQEKVQTTGHAADQVRPDLATQVEFQQGPTAQEITQAAAQTAAAQSAVNAAPGTAMDSNATYAAQQIADAAMRPGITLQGYAGYELGQNPFGKMF